MFTGIVLKMGKLLSLERKNNPTLTVDIGELKGVKIGDSVAVNGTCLTAVEIKGNIYKFNLSLETLKLSNFGDLPRGSFVNIELPLTLQDFLGGHMVSGHLDGVVRVKSINKGAGSTKISLVYQDPDWKKFLVHKGSVTLNGISLTISEIKSSFFSVEVIPHTLDTTTLKYIKVGERVNLELDLIGKYLYNLTFPAARRHR
ncbi:MAG: riboflavin synthase [bacterium]|nr:riboflavin synthase [bacterium]